MQHPPRWLAGILSMVCLAAAGAGLAAGDDLAQGFAVPPASARPWVYWFPLDGDRKSTRLNSSH